MQIWHEVHDAYQYSQTDSHREIDYRETYAEEYSHYQRHERLSTDIAVQLTLHVFHQRLPERAHLLGEYLYPAR